MPDLFILTSACYIIFHILILLSRKNLKNRKGDNMFQGIYAPIPTPFDGSGDIAWEKLRDNLDWWGKTSLHGLVVTGTNGEAVLLDSDEKARLYAFVRENLPSAKKVIAGTGTESARQTIRLNRAAAEGGADAPLVITPHYFKGSMNDEALENYYLQVAESSTLPIFLYNMPRNTNLNMNAGLVSRLSEHPNIIGIKDSGGNIVQIGKIIEKTGSDFLVSAGSAGFLLPALLLGAGGGTLALANVMPEECVDIYNLYTDGKLDQARDLQLRLLDINDAVTASYGVAGLKAAMDLIGHYGGPTRSPLLAITGEEKRQLQQIMQQCRLL